MDCDGSCDAVVDPPQTRGNKRDGEGEEDARFDRLECPEPACGLVDGLLEHVVVAETAADALKCTGVCLSDVA